MYKNLLLSILFVALTGCHIKENSNISQLLKRDDIYHIALINTQKAQLIASFETKAFLTATYLNPICKYDNCKSLGLSIDNNNGEYFFVGIYIANSDDKTYRFDKDGYSLILNGTKPTEIKELDRKNNKLIQEMPMVNNWSKYYRVKFPTVDNEKLEMIFQNSRFGKDILNFNKQNSSKN